MAASKQGAPPTSDQQPPEQDQTAFPARPDSYPVQAVSTLPGFIGKEFQFKNFLAMKLTAQMLYYH
jgi:hypothetical protein